MIILILSYIPSLICGVHVVRTGREMYWLMLFLMAPLLAPAFYFFAVLLPEMTSGRTARGIGKAAQRALDPEREYHAAMRALEDSPTVGARMKVAQAAAALGRWRDAEAQWALCAGGHWGDDPTILLGHAEALLELGRFDEALRQLEKLKALGPEGGAPRVALAFARAYEGLSRNAEAEDAYRFAADRVPGLEAGARYVAFMARTGRHDDAEIGFGEIERRYSKIAAPLRAEARMWRDMAAQALGRT